jgi:hypothetical protein
MEAEEDAVQLRKASSGREPAALTMRLQAGLRARRGMNPDRFAFPSFDSGIVKWLTRLTVAGAASGFHRFPVRHCLR